MVGEDATVTSKGQVTIPKKIRDKLGIKSGTEVTFILRGEEAILVPKSDNPLDEMRKLRDEIKFNKQEIESMIQDSKETWSKVQ
ncbi:MAG: AbrB/MazE/SpoVT family DNA-binding domain-containing protein [Halobacteria archaeon]|nr:AbrB/MazE/SpoVT family DNA-binding domain-containing protein [Halobacteria archaeon]